MVITLEPELEAALNQAAPVEGSRRVLVLNALRQRFLQSATPAVSHDEWELRLLGMARECGVSLPDTP